ncbi:uncharacterized protein LOC120107875 [Phoenix dactylifera]|uniref:Uncharacterized protein LOC120107875 n=1 Tax=Phoenix dactylifera TaxID=42345 RepID=A0A8B8ZSU6_PHODC|nr:uncharacterized protein LOC120107875 [Phoenix dactylifera]
MVVSWIQNSISNTLKSSVVFVDDASEIWMELLEHFSQQNGPRIFQLKKALAGLQQEHDLVGIYYGKLKTLWDELSMYDPMPECGCRKLKILFDRYQRYCVIQFLMGLNDSFANVRDQIILLDPLPLMNKVFSLVQQQKRQHQMVSNVPSPDSLTLVARNFFVNTKLAPKFVTTQKRDRPFCTHCNVQGHLLENCFKAGNAKAPICTHCNMTDHVDGKCYKLQGYPPSHKLFNKGKSPVTFANQSNISVPAIQDEENDAKVALTKG